MPLGGVEPVEPPDAGEPGADGFGLAPAAAGCDVGDGVEAPGGVRDADPPGAGMVGG